MSSRWQVAGGKGQVVYCLLLCLLFVQTLWAHGGGILQIGSQPAGPFNVSVWTSPTRLEAEETVHITVGVADEAEAPVLDAAVIVELTSLETGEIWTAQATTEQATNKLFYEADMRLGANGRYTMTIQIKNEQGTGETSFALEILPKNKNNWLLWGFIALGLILSMAMFQLWEKQPITIPSRQK